MDEEFLEVNDIDWFAVSQNGSLCHFATGGRGRVAGEVVRSMAAWERACEFVDGLSERFAAIVVEAGLPKFSSEKQRQGFVSMHLEMARKGLHSHDFCEGGYLLVARPADDSVRVEIPASASEGIPVLQVEYEEGGFFFRMD